MFWSIKKVKKHQGIKIGENQARSQSYKNRTIRFVKPEYPIFSEQIWSYLTQEATSYYLYKYRS
jgi:hypothetical protein